MSHEIWPPEPLPNIRKVPVSPQPLPPPTDPVSLPLIRPRPLYPKVSSRKESVWLPPM